MGNCSVLSILFCIRDPGIYTSNLEPLVVNLLIDFEFLGTFVDYFTFKRNSGVNWGGRGLLKFRKIVFVSCSSRCPLFGVLI